MMISRRIRAYLDLVRLPNLFTAMADILAGFLYVGGSIDEWVELLFLCGASICLYAGGAALNDVCDVARDRRERPDRPIPSNRVSRRGALILATFLLLGGACLAAMVSYHTALIAAVLVFAIVLYDAPFKSTPAAPALLGLCRAANLTLGMSVGAIHWSGFILAPVALMWLYATSVTFFSRNEAGKSSRERLLLGTFGVSLAVSGLVGLFWIVPDVSGEYIGPVVLLTVALAHRGLATSARADPASVQRTVAFFVLSVIAFDACLAWAARGPLAALAVASTLIPAIILGRMLRVT